MDIQVKIKYVILKSRRQVFNAIVNSDHLVHYFASKSSGNLVNGENVLWTFEDEDKELEIRVMEIEENSHVKFGWTVDGHHSIVDLKLYQDVENQCILEITEHAFERSQEGIKRAMSQTQGWTDFACSLKAYLYTDINLRTGSLVKGQKD